MTSSVTVKISRSKNPQKMPTISDLPKLPAMRSVWAASLAAFLICIIFYFFYGGLFTFALFLSLILGIFYYAQDILLYHPDLPTNSRTHIPLPSMHNLPQETLNIRTNDNVTLHAFWVPQRDERSKIVPTFIYLHGNAGNIGHRMPNVWGIFYYLHCNILMLEYRGYGLSTGSPSESGLIKDCHAAIDYLYTRHDLDHTQIVLFGRSLGGAVAIDVAADTVYSQKIMAMIVENTFTSIPEMAVEIVHPNVKYIPDILYKNKFPSINKIKNCSVPSLFLSGLADTLVPPRMMRKLYDDCGSDRKKILEFKDGLHNDTWLCDGYYKGINKFLKDCQNISPPLQKPPEKSNVWSEIQDV